MLDCALTLAASIGTAKRAYFIVSFTKQALTALKRIFIVVGIAIAFTVGLFGAIYLSLRSSNTTVPDIVGKDRASAENSISAAGLNFRVRAMRPSSNAKPDTVIIQVPESGKIVKVGQTVAVDMSRPAKEGESSLSTNPNANANTEKKPENTNSANSNSNDNKEKKKPANKNANDNLNANGAANRAPNRNRNKNVNSLPTGNENANPAGTPVHSNLNSNSTPRGNANRGAGNVNSNRPSPVTAPTP